MTFGLVSSIGGYRGVSGVIGGVAGAYRGRIGGVSGGYRGRIGGVSGAYRGGIGGVSGGYRGRIGGVSGGIGGVSGGYRASEWIFFNLVIPVGILIFFHYGTPLIDCGSQFHRICRINRPQLLDMTLKIVSESGFLNLGEIV